MKNNIKNDGIKIVVMSDTHGKIVNVKKILDVINEADCVIHLGDGRNDIKYFAPKITTKIVTVAGNCDFSSIAPIETILEIGNSRFFLTHGHTYGVKRSLIKLGTKAAQENCDYVLYGHTHSPLITENQGTPKKAVTMINPGSLAGNIGCRPTFAILVGSGEQFFTKFVEL